MVIYSPKKVAGSSLEARGFISHSCFPFLGFMVLGSGRTRLKSCELSPLLPASPHSLEALGRRRLCALARGGPIAGDAARGGWSGRPSSSTVGIGNTSPKDLDLKTEVNATTCCWVFFFFFFSICHLTFDFP